MTDNGLLSSDELIGGTRITYRQLHYWASKGALPPFDYPGGPGSRMRWSPSDRERILELDKHLAALADQHLYPTVEHLRWWWQNYQAA